MTLILVVVGSVLALAVTAAVVAMVVGAQLRRHRGAERDATVHAAVDTVLAMAGDKLGDHLAAGSREMALRGEALDQRFTTMATELGRVTELVTSLQRERAEQHGQVVSGLAEAARSTATLAETTQGLRQALANPKARGQWGERLADDVLRLAGFVEGVSYRRQTALPCGTIPDVTFLLPNDLLLHMDVKFPIDNYLRALEAGRPAERQAFEAAFLRDVRNRIGELAGRGYVDPPITVDYVLAFIPNEAVYAFVHEADPALVDTALAQKVVLCSPCSLFAVLAVIRQAVDAFALERTSDEILACLAGFADQWGRFSEQLDLVAKRMETAQRGFEDLAGPRRRQLQRRLDDLAELRTRRGLGDNLTDADDPADDDPTDEAAAAPVEQLREVRQRRSVG
ncbi:hypothetical protein BH20ACT2_BH20ACT2_07750 [soil metagenome]